MKGFSRTLNFSSFLMFVCWFCIFFRIIVLPLCQYVSTLNFVGTSPTLNIYLCCRRPVPNIPPRIPDRPYSGRLNWASSTQWWRETTPPRATQDASLTAWGKVLFGWPMTGHDETGNSIGWNWREKNLHFRNGNDKFSRNFNFRPM